MTADEDALRPPLTNGNLIRLYDYWNDRRRGRAFPARADIDPLDFAYVLGNVVLVDVLHAPLKFRYRLVGVNLVRRDGFDMTHKLVDDFPEPQFREVILRGFTEIIEQRRPLSSVRDLFVDGRARRYEALRLPLSSNGTDIDMILVATEYVA